MICADNHSWLNYNALKQPDKNWFCSSLKDGTTDDNGEKLNGHIRDKNYLTWKKVWNEFNMKNMGDYHDHDFKKDILFCY